MSALTDRIAVVLQAELDEHGCEDDDEKRWQVARHWADRIAAELALTEEWAVDERGIFGKWHKTRQSAQKHCDTIVRNFWVIHEGVAGACMAEPHPVPVRRWVSGWQVGK